MEFIHLHNHTEYSLLDGAMRIEELVKTAKRMGMSSLAITDHGNLFGVVEFYNKAMDNGIKPIIGIETYVAPRDRKEKRIYPDIPESNFHFILLATNEKGYKNLLKLSSLAYLEGFYYKPRIDKELLNQYREGLIGLSGCLKGEIPYYLLRGDKEKARKSALEYQEILGKGNFFLEIQDLALPENKKVIPEMLELSKSLDIPVVATNDCHYLSKEDAHTHDVLLCIQTGKKLSDRYRLRFNTQEVYFKSPEEMVSLFSEVPEAIKNTLKISERCNLLLDFSGKNFYLPQYPTPEGFKTTFDYLSYIAREGLKKRYQTITPEIEDRLSYELSTINKMGFSGYILIIKDIVDFAKRKGIPVGPGRGSAVSSVVLYSLGITDVDPLKYGLIFERFLNPNRITLPDIDIDFGDTRRDEVIEYIKERYGKENVAQIITFGTMQARAVVRDVGRVLEISYAEVDRLAKLIPFGSSLRGAISLSEELKSLIDSNPQYQELFKIAEKLEGMPRHASIHASGVVITPKSLTEFVPLYRSSEGDISTQYDMNAIASCGLPKMDILGLRTLSVIDDTLKILKDKGKDLNRIPLDDKKTFELLHKGETVGIFQLESPGMRDILKKFKPEDIEGLIAVISLYRPGPLGSVDISKFILRRYGKEKVIYPHPLTEPILKETYGIILYQEQVMRIAAVIAGFSLAQADTLRRAMGKKIPEIMVEQRKNFVEGAKRKGIKEETAEKIFDMIAPFAGYGFNKSHSAGYAHLAYETAYLKANYPVEFMCASLNSELGKQDKLYKLIREARRMGIKVLPPDINKSLEKFSIEEERIRFGLAGIKNVGKASESIINARKSPFISLLDFLKRTKVNKKSAESLIKAGALDSINPDRVELLSNLDKELQRASSKRIESLELQSSFFESPKSVKKSQKPKSIDLLAYEKDGFGFYFSGHPLEKYKDEYEGLGLIESSRLEELKEEESVRVGGVIASRRVKRDKRNREYLHLVLEDFDGEIEVFVFNELYKEVGKTLKADTPIAVKGRLKRGKRPTITANTIIPLSKAGEYIKSLYIDLNMVGLTDDALISLKEQLLSSPGRCEVLLYVYNRIGEKSKPRIVRLKEHKVDPNSKLLSNLRNIAGVEGVRIKGKF